MRLMTGRFALLMHAALRCLRIVAWCGLLLVADLAKAEPPPTPTPSATGTVPNQPLSVGRVMSLPGPSPRTELFVKPGHWTTAWIEATAADADFRGTLDAQWVDDAGAPLAFPPLQFRLRHERPLILPKGQLRGAEQLVFTPNDDDAVGPGRLDRRESRLREASGRFRLDDEASLRPTWETRQRATALRDHQALFVVLAERPADYAFIGGLDAIAAPHSPTILPEQDAHYRTVFAAEPSRPLLPTSVLGWTTTAYMLWDGYDLAKLSDAQRQALVDWLHWGGVLIVAGPGTLDGPNCEPLRPWLPAEADGVLELDAAALAPLVELAIDGDLLDTTRRWTGVRLRPTTEGRVVVGTAALPLVVERRVGRGRIVATAFRPAQTELVAWASYAGFFNTHLMRRPARYWRPHPDDAKFTAAVWNDRRDIYFDNELRRGTLDPWFDPTRVTGVRFATRGGAGGGERLPLLDAQPPIGSGVAAWRDDDELAELTRGVLRDASGIFVPSATLVLGLIVAYVTTAVPVNWLVFRVLGRTEWAWLATPVLAVLFTVIVVRAAELDLGFVRSACDVTIVEIQPDYERGHVTRYIALYNSLGTEYTIGGDDPTFVALPLAPTTDKKQLPIERTYTVVRRDDEAGTSSTALMGFVVESSSVGLVRTEQMMPLGGALQAEELAERRYRIRNGTRWELRDVRLTGLGRGAIDVLPPGAAADVTLNDDEPPSGDEPARRATIDVDSLWRRLQTVDPNETLRLTAWSSTVTPGPSIDPPLSQQRQKTIVVAHLRYAADPPPVKESNTRVGVEQRRPVIPHP